MGETWAPWGFVGCFKQAPPPCSLGTPEQSSIMRLLVPGTEAVTTASQRRGTQPLPCGLTRWETLQIYCTLCGPQNKGHVELWLLGPPCVKTGRWERKLACAKGLGQGPGHHPQGLERTDQPGCSQVLPPS